MELFEANQDATYSVAWIDCLAGGADLGRSLVMLGEHAERDDLPSDKRQTPFLVPRKRKRKVPFDFPALALNRYSVRAFNALYYRAGCRQNPSAIGGLGQLFLPAGYHSGLEPYLWTQGLCPVSVRPAAGAVRGRLDRPA